MAIRWPQLPEGTRVRVRRASIPQDPAITGRTGTVVNASEYTAHELGVVLDGESRPRWFTPQELEPVERPALGSPDRAAAKKRRALP